MLDGQDLQRSIPTSTILLFWVALGSWWALIHKKLQTLHFKDFPSPAPLSSPPIYQLSNEECFLWSNSNTVLSHISFTLTSDIVSRVLKRLRIIWFLRWEDVNLKWWRLNWTLRNYILFRIIQVTWSSSSVEKEIY